MPCIELKDGNGKPFAFITVALGPFKIRDARGRVWRFEWHDYGGPWVVGARGQEVAQPGGRSPFWTPVTLWDWQGRRVDAEGFCAWNMPRPPTYKHLGGRHYTLETPGDEMWHRLYPTRMTTPARDRPAAQPPKPD